MSASSTISGRLSLREKVTPSATANAQTPRLVRKASRK